jgi:nickel-dependent lactate racemase
MGSVRGFEMRLGSAEAELSSSDLRSFLFEALRGLGPRKRVLIVPPDFTRLHSRAGELTRCAWDYYGDAVRDVLPALGTHGPMSAVEIERMFPGVPASIFRVHDWRRDATTIGSVPADFVAKATGGAVDMDWPVQLSRRLVEGAYDLILSIGQVVPHEVMGMANYSKNLFVGLGGKEAIDRSHFIGAVCGLESLMGKADNPLRSILDWATDRYLRDLPVVYVHTVVGCRLDGSLATRGLFIGSDRRAFEGAAELSAEVNIFELEEPIRKAVVYLDPDEYRSTWLGNKAIYRARMAMADGGELLILAPGLRRFGEDVDIDRLIRKHGYRGTPAILKALREDEELAGSLCAAAHLIHGSPEGRFGVTYCPGWLSADEVESVGFRYLGLAEARRAYPPELLKEGWNEAPLGERFFFIANPALGLWAYRAKKSDSNS